MKVREIMTRDVKFCGPDTNLAEATEIMWRNNCGALPVLDPRGELIGLITDRDLCIALGTTNCRASDLTVRQVAMKPVFTCAPDDYVHEALKTMRQHQVRRVPAVTEDGKLAGILSLDEIVLHAEKGWAPGISYTDVVNAMKAICQHRTTEELRLSA